MRWGSSPITTQRLPEQRLKGRDGLGETVHITGAQLPGSLTLIKTDRQCLQKKRQECTFEGSFQKLIHSRPGVTVLFFSISNWELKVLEDNKNRCECLMHSGSSL